MIDRRVTPGKVVSLPGDPVIIQDPDLWMHKERRMLGWSYSKFEGLNTPFHWFDRLLCKLFGHPGRSYFMWLRGDDDETEVCARCCKERE